MKRFAWVLVSISFVVGSSAHAQKEIPKAEGYDQCPLGYINTLGAKCVSSIYCEVVPTYGVACELG